MDQELFIPDQKEIFQYHATFKNYVIFDIPYKLEDTSIVKEWYIKWGVLRIILTSGEEVTIDGAISDCDYKHPDNVYNEAGDDILEQ
jgi:hypothetical protein